MSLYHAEEAISDIILCLQQERILDSQKFVTLRNL